MIIHFRTRYKIYFYSSLGCVAVCGDLNSRVGNKTDFVVHDDVNIVNILFDDPSYIPDSTPSPGLY